LHGIIYSVTFELYIFSLKKRQIMSDYKNEFKLQGKIKFIDDKANISKSGGEFFTREFCLSMEEESMGDVTENDIKFQCVRNNCEKIEPFNVGDEVIVYFSMKGAFGGAKPKEGKPKSPKNPNSLTCMSNANAWKIELVKKAEGVSDSNSDAKDKQEEWDKQQQQQEEWDKQQQQQEKHNRDLKDKNVPHPGMKWDTKKKEWVSPEPVDDLPF